MLRPFAFEFVLFALPFIAHLLWLLIQGQDVLDPNAWRGRRLGLMIAAGLFSMLIGFVIFGHLREAPANAVYVPAHLENGKLVPPQLK